LATAPIAFARKEYIMALSLLQHLRDTRRSLLIQHVSKHMQRSQAESVVDLSIPLVLAHLVSLNQQHGTSLVIALLNTQAQDGLWKTLDHDRLLKQISQAAGIDTSQAQSATNHVAHDVLVELHALYDQASLGDEGLNELLMAQPALLQGHAPDWIWTLAELAGLNGQHAVAPADVEELTVDRGIAELHALMRDAKQDPLMTPTPDHNDHTPVIDAPTQRAAGPWARCLAPVVALIVLMGLVMLYQHNHAEQHAGRLVAPQGKMQGQVDTETAPPVALPDPTNSNSMTEEQHLHAPMPSTLPTPPQPMPDQPTAEPAVSATASTS
jgi:hypothetical protein